MVSYSFQGTKRLWSFRDANEIDEGTPQTLQASPAPVPVALPSFVTDPDSDKWPVAQIMRLLRFYAAHRCLWDLECEDNRNRRMRHAALVDIAAAMGGGVTKDQVVQKINVIRATYRYEKKRIKQRMRRGQGARTKLKWFALADAFLRGVPKKGCSKEDPPNSDSDLEDAVIFTINPETLIPLEPETITDEPEQGAHDDSVAFLEPKIEANTDESQQPWDMTTEDLRRSEVEKDAACLKQPKLELVESQLQEQLKDYYETTAVNGECQGKERSEKVTENKEIVKQESSDTNVDEAAAASITKASTTTTWTLETSLQFISLLKEHNVLCLATDDKAALTFTLQAIANVMDKPLTSIEKRWTVLKQVYEEEKEKILVNPKYTPPYKWWSVAQQLMESHRHIKTESIYLEEKANSQYSSDNEDEYEQRFQNPIPSVAPLSNMNEAMASLFHDDDFSSSSNTHSSFPLTTATSSPQSMKIVWNGLEDDLLEGKWSLKHSVKFLRLYGAHKCLWDLNDPDYRSRALRNAAIEDIAASMGHGLTATYVAKKIKIFRITYMQQRKRLLDAMERGEKPEILLKWFPLADSFLRPHIGLRSIKADAKEMPQFDLHYVYANLNLIDPALLTDFRGKGTQNAIAIGNDEEELSGTESDAEQI